MVRLHELAHSAHSAYLTLRTLGSPGAGWLNTETSCFFGKCRSTFYNHMRLYPCCDKRLLSCFTGDKTCTDRKTTLSKICLPFCWPSMLASYGPYSISGIVSGTGTSCNFAIFLVLLRGLIVHSDV